jgi:hypothetical protein
LTLRDPAGNSIDRTENALILGLVFGVAVVPIPYACPEKPQTQRNAYRCVWADFRISEMMISYHSLHS